MRYRASILGPARGWHLRTLVILLHYWALRPIFVDFIWVSNAYLITPLAAILLVTVWWGSIGEITEITQPVFEVAKANSSGYGGGSGSYSSISYSLCDSIERNWTMQHLIVGLPRAISMAGIFDAKQIPFSLLELNWFLASRHNHRPQLNLLPQCQPYLHSSIKL